MAALRYFDPQGSPFRIAMGLRRLDLAEWIEVDEDYEADVARKEALLDRHRDQVVAALPEGDAGSAEAAALLEEHLATRFPGLTSSIDRPRAGEAPPMGRKLTSSVAEHPLAAASRRVQEDLCLMHRGTGEWVLAAAAVCFPSRWSLADKIGRSLTAIHEPVPGYQQQLATPAERFFDRIRADRPMWRLNWTLTDDAELFQPAGPAVAAQVDPGALTVRVERQTLRLLPDSGDVLFTIRTYRGALADAMAARPGAAADLLGTLRTVPAEFIDYRGWGAIMPALLGWLSELADRQDGGTGTAP